MITVLSPWVMLIGCDALNGVQDAIDDLLDPVVVQGVVLGIEEPDSAEIRPFLDGTDFAAGVAVTIFLADASSADDLDDAPIVGALVSVDTPAGAVTVTDEGGGVYTIVPGDAALSYVVGEAWTIRAEIDERDDLSEATSTLPPAADASLSLTHITNAPLDVDLAGQGFDSAFIAVIDSNGAITWTNEPKTAQEVYEMAPGSAEVGIVTIPPEAFPTDAVYAVGVAGLVGTENDDEQGMNTALSTVMAGKMQFYAVSTIP